MTMCKLRAQNPVAHQPKLFSQTRVSLSLSLFSFLVKIDLTRHAKNVPQGQRGRVRGEREKEREEREGYTLGLFAINIYAEELYSFIEKRSDPRRPRKSSHFFVPLPPIHDV